MPRETRRQAEARFRALPPGRQLVEFARVAGLVLLVWGAAGFLIVVPLEWGISLIIPDVAARWLWRAVIVLGVLGYGRLWWRRRKARRAHRMREIDVEWLGEMCDFHKKATEIAATPFADR